MKNRQMFLLFLGGFIWLPVALRAGELSCKSQVDHILYDQMKLHHLLDRQGSLQPEVKIAWQTHLIGEHKSVSNSTYSSESSDLVIIRDNSFDPPAVRTVLVDLTGEHHEMYVKLNANCFLDAIEFIPPLPLRPFRINSEICNKLGSNRTKGEGLRDAKLFKVRTGQVCGPDDDLIHEMCTKYAQLMISLRPGMSVPVPLSIPNVPRGRGTTATPVGGGTLH